jgi:signal transduction histidine kinase
MQRLTADLRQAAFLTVGTWLLSGILYLVPYHVFQGGAGTYVALSVTNICCAGALLSIGVLAAARASRRRSRAARAGIMVAAVVGASAVLAAYDAVTSQALAAALDLSTELPPLPLRATNNFVALVWQFALLAAVYTIVESNKLARERERELAGARQAAIEAEASASAARLAALRYQMNPHVLFNTLNAVSSLIVTRCYQEADAMLAKLSDFLRATLSADPESMIPLEDELATVQHYLEIEAVRFEDRLAVEFVCPPGLNDAMVPSFVIQPLVENAVKYAVAPADRPVTVRVEAARNGDDLLVMVEDDGTAEPGEVRPGTGVGIGNVRQRLQVLFGPRGTLETMKRERGFVAIVRLPLSWRVATFARVA